MTCCVNSEDGGEEVLAIEVEWLDVELRMGRAIFLEWKVMMKSDIVIEVGNIYTIMYMWFDICSRNS